MVNAKSENVGFENQIQGSLDNRPGSVVDAESQNVVHEKQTVEDKDQATCQSRGEEIQRSEEIQWSLKLSDEVSSHQQSDDRGSHGHCDEIRSREQHHEVASHDFNDDSSDESKTETSPECDEIVDSYDEGEQNKSLVQFPPDIHQIDEITSSHDQKVEMSPKQDKNDQPYLKDSTDQISVNGSQELHDSDGSQDLSPIDQRAGDSSLDLCDNDGSCDEESMDDSHSGFIVQNSDKVSLCGSP